VAESPFPWLEAPAKGLYREFEAGSLGHAPLLHGPKGIGKLTLSHALAETILCHSPLPASGGACGQCSACQLMAGGTHPDFFQVARAEDAKDITVDQVRELIDKVALTPAMGAHRVAVIESAELMNENAANALLKTLEEPPDNVWLIVVSHAPGRLPPTIWSRCQKVGVPLPDPKQARDWLDQAGAAFEPAHRELALTMSSGAPCLALAYLEAGLIETANEIWDTLSAIAQGQGIPPQLSEQWSENAQATWTCLAHWVCQLATGHVSIVHQPDAIHASEARRSPDWSELWNQALEGLALVGSGVRHDLLIGRWLLAWEDRCQQAA